MSKWKVYDCAQRLVSGPFNPHDVTTVLQYLRHLHRDNRPAIADMGDFLGHVDVKDRGPVVENVRDFLTMVRFSRAGVLSPKDLPLATFRVADANFRIPDPD